MLGKALEVGRAGEPLEGITEVQQDLVPTLDQEHPVASYADWNIYNTHVITCTLGNSPHKGLRFANREDALKGVTQQYGKIYEANYVPGRAFFRVARKAGS